MHVKSSEHSGCTVSPQSVSTVVTTLAWHVSGRQGLAPMQRLAWGWGLPSSKEKSVGINATHGKFNKCDTVADTTIVNILGVFFLSVFFFFPGTCYM